MPNQALIDARFLAAIDRDGRAGNGAQPPPPPSRRDGPGTRALAAISWALVAVMVVAIAVLALTG
ncbi:hypothetical protein HJD18_00865 [Thermoleophilia bacterium SCSIO 60948]|nr:hypothetical protein HJD18_00865 [Thermoleophilia bacterium SCSIO 60948]